MTTKKKYHIEGYSFQELGGGKGKVRNFQPNDFSKFEREKLNYTDKNIREERKAARETRFQFFDIVSEHRGQKKQAEIDYEKRVEQEVQKRLSALQEDAYRDGFEKGKESGFESAKEESLKTFNTQVEEISLIIQEIQDQRESLQKNNRDEIYRMLKTLVKWVSLKEFTKDSYLPKLLEKLVLELNQKHNLLVKVNKNDFDRMPIVLQQVEERIGKLTNVRVEVESQMTRGGIILESDRGIIDASTEVQFATLDKTFEALGVVDE